MATLAAWAMAEPIESAKLPSPFFSAVDVTHDRMELSQVGRAFLRRRAE
jgi:hypothetical protein